MAKVSMIARENKRIKMVQKFAKKREELKKVISDMNISDEERYELPTINEEFNIAGVMTDRLND
jgi:small subunit ribosomal protein S14